MDMRAICSHRNNCQFSSTCGLGRRPVGRVWDWLDAAERPEFSTKELHRGYVPEYETRVTARDEFEMLPGCDNWLEAESGGVGLPEPRETW